MPLSFLLVWTPCLMHRCVCIWRYTLQNYNYKVHFQNLSTYHIPHVSMGTLAAENLDVCTACDPWGSKIQLTVVKDRRPVPGMPFLDSDTCAEGGGVIYFCQGLLPCMMPSMDGWMEGSRDAIHGWMTGRMDGWVTWCHPWMDDGMNGWMEKASQPRRRLLYIMYRHKAGSIW
jgi:hypothetical protein